MAKEGDEIVNPVTGHRIIFRKTTQDTNGELLQMDWIGRPGWRAGPVHVHSFQEERFEVLSGTLGSHVAGVERTHKPGETRWSSRRGPRTRRGTRVKRRYTPWSSFVRRRCARRPCSKQCSVLPKTVSSVRFGFLVTRFG